MPTRTRRSSCDAQATHDAAHAPWAMVEPQGLGPVQAPHAAPTPTPCLDAYDAWRSDAGLQPDTVLPTASLGESALADTGAPLDTSDWLVEHQAGALSKGRSGPGLTSANADQAAFRTDGTTPTLTTSGVGIQHRRSDWSHPDSTKDKAARSATVGGSISKDGVTASGSETRRFGDRDITTSGSVTSDGTVRAGVSARKDDKSGHSVHGSVKLDDDSGKITLGVSGTSAPGARTGAQGTAGGSVLLKWKASEPELVEGLWVVDYSATMGLTGSVGAKKSGTAADTGHKGGVSGEARGHVQRVVDGRRSFASRQEADGFRRGQFAFVGAPLTAGSALTLVEGDTGAARFDGSIGGRMDGNLEGSHAGLGGSFGGSQGVDVERLSGERVRVTRTGSTGTTGELRGGVGPLSLEGSHAGTEHDQQSWILDLSVAEAREAYEGLVRFGTAPQEGPGIHVADRHRASLTRTLGGANVGGIGTMLGTERVDATHVDAEGVETHERTGSAFTEANGSSTWTGKQGLTAGTVHSPEGDEVDAYVLGRAQVDGGSLYGNMETLGRFGGTYSWRGSGEGTPGQFTAEVSWGADSLDRLIDTIRAPGFNPDGYRPPLPASTRALIDDLRSCGNDRETQLALLEAHGTGGADHIKGIQAIMGKGDVYVGLEDSEVWIGRGGHLEANERLTALRAAIERGSRSRKDVRAEAQEEFDTHSVRLMKLQDEGRFQDVPGPMRREEQTRTRRLMKAARDLIEDASGAPFAPSEERARFDAMLTEVDKFYARGRTARAEHTQGITGKDLRSLGDPGLWGWGRGEEADAYEEADAAFEKGESLRREAISSLKSAIDQSQKGFSELSSERSAQGIRELGEALAAFITADRRYGEIAARH